MEENMKTVRTIGVILALCLFAIPVSCCRQCSQLSGSKLLIDDIEGDVAADYGSGNGAECTVAFVKKGDSTADVYSGEQAMKITYDKSFGGYLYCARGFGLTPAIPVPQEKLVWSVKPESIDFKKYNAFGFFFKGQNTGNTVAVDLFDKDREIFRCEFADDTAEWKEMVIPLSHFKLRTDYQPDWNKSNKAIDFPIVTYQFEPLTGTGKEIKGDLFIDAVHFDVLEGIPQAPAAASPAPAPAEDQPVPQPEAAAEAVQQAAGEAVQAVEQAVTDTVDGLPSAPAAPEAPGQ
jgi:hypothetical protein